MTAVSAAQSDLEAWVKTLVMQLRDTQTLLDRERSKVAISDEKYRRLDKEKAALVRSNKRKTAKIVELVHKVEDVRAERDENADAKMKLDQFRTQWSGVAGALGLDPDIKQESE